MKLTREITFRPAYDKRPKNPGEPNYGIHGGDMTWYVKGSKGVIQFVVHTNWYLPHVAKELSESVLLRPSYFTTSEIIAYTFQPHAVELGYHAKRRQYEGQEKRKDCHLFKNGCYYDGSGLNAEPVLKLLIEQGSDAVWARLEKEYYERFDYLPEVEEAA